VTTRRIAFVYGTTLGAGGLGVQAGNALRALAASGAAVDAIGPGHVPGWTAPAGVTWHSIPRPPLRLLSLRPLRTFAGLHQQFGDRHVGARAARVVAQVRPDLCYAFSQVALETLTWAAQHAVPAVLESPNGHIAAFRQVYLDETARWCGGSHLGHPTAAMVTRVEQEYALAPHIRVSSAWSRTSIAQGGVDATRISVFQQPVDLDHFALPPRQPSSGPLRVCFVGSLDPRKGFVYLLQAAQRHGTVAVDLIGGTGDRCSAGLLARFRDGVAVQVTAGDPRPALARADLFVLPTLEDGSPFAVAEAMAASLPVVTTSATGAAEWIRHGETGWVVAPRSVDEIVNTFVLAKARRAELPAMGRAARADTEARVRGADAPFINWIGQLR